MANPENIPSLEKRIQDSADHFGYKVRRPGQINQEAETAPNWYDQKVRARLTKRAPFLASTDEAQGESTQELLRKILHRQK
jgi:hypothetical protein